MLGNSKAPWVLGKGPISIKRQLRLLMMYPGQAGSSKFPRSGSPVLIAQRAENLKQSWDPSRYNGLWGPCVLQLEVHMEVKPWSSL